MKQLLKNCATSIPDSNVNFELHKAVRQRMKNSLIEHIECCEQNFSTDLKDILNAAQQLDIERQFSPEFYFRLYELEQSLKNQNANRLMDAIMAVKTLLAMGVYNSSGYKISSILAEPWEVNYVEHLRSYDQLNIRGEKTLVLPIINTHELEYHKQQIELAMNMIRLHDPEVYSEIIEFVVDIKLFKGRVLRGDTSARTFGSMWIRVPEPEDDQVGYWIEHIVHEVSHLRLEAHFFLEPLVHNPITELKFKAPIRDDPRPMRGIFHACFVLARMTRVFRRLSIEGYDSRFRDRLQLCLLQLEVGIASVFHKDAQLSNNALLIRESFRPCLAS